MNYYIEYKYLTDLVLDETVEIQHSAKFIDRILISTQPFENIEEFGDDFRRFKNILEIKFEISNYFDNCQEQELKDFFEFGSEINKNTFNITKGSESSIIIVLKKQVALIKSKDITDYIVCFVLFHSIDEHFEFKTEIISLQESEELLCSKWGKLYINGEIFSAKLQKLRSVLYAKNYLPEKPKDVVFEISSCSMIPIRFEPDYAQRYLHIKNKLKSIDWDNSYYSAIYSIVNNKEIDNISKYIILYSLLLEICGKQKELDDPKGKDKGQQGKIERFLLMLGYDQPRKNYKNKSETIISNIRNKIGHSSQEKIDLNTLQKETFGNLNSLLFALKQAIIKYKL